MTMSQMFLIIALFIAAFCILDRVLSIWIKDDDTKGVDTWQESQRTLGQLGGSVLEQSSNRPIDRIGARSVNDPRQTRTLRGDITRLSAHFKRITRTKS